VGGVVWCWFWGLFGFVWLSGWNGGRVVGGGVLGGVGLYLIVCWVWSAERLENLVKDQVPEGMLGGDTVSRNCVTVGARFNVHRFGQ